MERLSAHPGVRAYAELLRAGKTGWPTWPPGAGDRPHFGTYLDSQGRAKSRTQRHLHLFEFLDYLYAAPGAPNAIGFKLMYRSAAQYPQLLAYFRRRSVRVLHLVRSNLLDIALSRFTMHLRKSSHAWSPNEREEIRVLVDTRTLHWVLRRLERDRAIARLVLQAARLPVYEMTYEDLLVSDRSLYSALDFLGVTNPAACQLATTMVKLAPISHRAGIANYEAVEACLHGTRFHRYLRSD